MAVEQIVPAILYHNQVCTVSHLDTPQAPTAQVTGLKAADQPAHSQVPGPQSSTRGRAAAVPHGRSVPGPRPPARTPAGPTTVSPPARATAAAPSAPGPYTPARR